MFKLIFFLFIIVAHAALGNESTTVTGNVATENYNQMAKRILAVELRNLERDLQAFNEKTLPHEAKQLRKDIVVFRDYIDLFAYSLHFDQSYDIYNDLRIQLDKGYDALGEFKDLYDTSLLMGNTNVKYNEEEVVVYRRKVLKWKQNFLNQKTQALYFYFVHHIPEGLLYERNKNLLSKFYWGGTDLIPDLTISGLDNIKYLVRENLLQSQHNIVRIQEMDNLLLGNNEEYFHDLRKRLRVVIKIATYFPRLLNQQTKNSQALVSIDTFVSKYGEVNDLLTAYHLAEKRNHKKKMKQLALEIRFGLLKLQFWQMNHQIEQAISSLVVGLFDSGFDNSGNKL